MRCFLLALQLLAGCQANFDSKVSKPPESHHFREWRCKPIYGPAAPVTHSPFMGEFHQGR